jgi:hypothetical protein
MQVAIQSRHGAPLLRALAPCVRALLGGGGSVTPGASRASGAPQQGAAAAFSTGTPQPPNAMALIKELREKSGAPISDVKVRPPRGRRAVGLRGSGKGARRRPPLRPP